MDSIIVATWIGSGASVLLALLALLAVTTGFKEMKEQRRLLKEHTVTMKEDIKACKESIQTMQGFFIDYQTILKRKRKEMNKKRLQQVALIASLVATSAKILSYFL